MATPGTPTTGKATSPPKAKFLWSPCNPAVRHKPTGAMPSPHNSGGVHSNGYVTPTDIPKYTGTQLPNLHFNRGGARTSGHYAKRTAAYGSPNVVKQIFNGTLPRNYFNNMCYGNPPKTKTPSSRERAVQLWAPRDLPKQQDHARHLDINIVSARQRRRNQIEEKVQHQLSLRAGRQDTARLKMASSISRGMQAYLDRLAKEKLKRDAKLLEKRGKQNNTKTISIPAS